MATPFIAQISLFAGTFAPRGWMFCNGQTLPIQQYTALFALIGTTYGGNGQTTFALPDLRGRVPLGTQQGPGLSNYSLGQMSGTETVTLLSTQIPAHNHALQASTAAPSTPTPANASLPTGSSRIYAAGGASQTLNPTSIGNAGGSQPHENMQPYLALNYIIAIEGVFPSRN
ncbi:MAG: phage tail protein [Sandaracinaceae bacterium]|nr:phage tail protein [Sandaracinaceae bacterium]